MRLLAMVQQWNITLHYMSLVRRFYPKRLTYSILWAIWGEVSCPGTQRHADCSGVWTWPPDPNTNAQPTTHCTTRPPCFKIMHAIWISCSEYSTHKLLPLWYRPCVHLTVQPLGGTHEQVTNNIPYKGITSLLMSLTSVAAYQHSVSHPKPRKHTCSSFHSFHLPDYQGFQFKISFCFPEVCCRGQSKSGCCPWQAALIDCLIRCNYADRTADNYKSVNTFRRSIPFHHCKWEQSCGSMLLTFCSTRWLHQVIETLQGENSTLT